MPTALNSDFNQMLAIFIDRFFFVFGLIGVAVGIGLAVNHVGVRHIFHTLDKWVSVRRSAVSLVESREFEQPTLRFPRLAGAVFLIVAAFSTFVLITRIDVDRIATVLQGNLSYRFTSWLVDSIRWSLVTGCILAIVVGFMLILRPQALQQLGDQINSWFSQRTRNPNGGIVYTGFDNWIEKHPRMNGTLIAAAALVVVVEYGMRLFAGS